MVTGNYITQKWLEPLKERQRKEGREQGREEACKEWGEWFERRQKAEKSGEPFDDPRPDQR